MVRGMVERLVQDGVRSSGRFARRPRVVNPLDEVGPLRRKWRTLRLKEWVGFTLVHPELWSSMIVQDAHYLASSELYVHDRASGRLHQHSVNARGGSPGFSPELFGTRCGVRTRAYPLDYEFAERAGTHRIRFDIAASATEPAMSGELDLDGGAASPALSVSAPLPGGAMYTHKAIYPVRGWMRVGQREYEFDGERDLAILDEHRSLLPYRTGWLWGTFASRTADGLVGANFADRATVLGSEEESCLWTPDAAEELSDVTFRRESEEPLAPWSIRSADDRLRVRFEPAGRKVVAHQLGLFAIDYVQYYGTYSGVVRGARGSYEIEGAHGVCESMRARL